MVVISESTPGGFIPINAYITRASLCDIHSLQCTKDDKKELIIDIISLGNVLSLNVMVLLLQICG